MPLHAKPWNPPVDDDYFPLIKNIFNFEKKANCSFKLIPWSGNLYQVTLFSKQVPSLWSLVTCIPGKEVNYFFLTKWTSIVHTVQSDKNAEIFKPMINVKYFKHDKNQIFYIIKSTKTISSMYKVILCSTILYSNQTSLSWPKSSLVKQTLQQVASQILQIQV